MKILAVCGFGVGSSMILRMSIEKVLKELDIKADVENQDVNSARGIPCDAIFTSIEIGREIAGTVSAKVYTVKKYMDLVEVRVAVNKMLEENNK